MAIRTRTSSAISQAMSQLSKLAGASRTARRMVESMLAGKSVPNALGYIGEQVQSAINTISSSAKPAAGPPKLRAGQTRRQQEEMLEDMRRFFEQTGAMGPPPPPPPSGGGRSGSGGSGGSGGGNYNSPPPPSGGGGGGYGRYGDPQSDGAAGSGGRFPTGITGQPAPPRPGERSPFGEEILTPQSSNVFSFSYVRDAGQRVGTLYVTYDAPALDASKIEKGRVRQGRGLSREQLIGGPGAYLGRAQSKSRGPMYAYLKVPPAIYTQMREAHSKGKFVWDKLRVRGTIHGHQYQYVLVQGAVIPGQGISGTYIPRRATAKGFATRSVRDLGAKGRVGTFQTSTLAARSFNSRTAPRR